MPVPDSDERILQRAAGGSSDYTASVAGELAAVRQCMSEQLRASDATVDEMLAYVAARAGKMLRPAMLLLTGASCGEVSEDHVRTAAVVELIHAATLLHDDVLDEAESRRSVQTANRLWGNVSAILLGDFLLSKVFVMSTALKPPEAGQLLSRATVETCRGELRQNVERGNWRLREESYYEIVREKTAVLFAAACRLGSLISGGPEERHLRFAEYGLKVGTAFQISDDLLDFVGDEERVGKTLGTDLANKKLTLPLIHLLGRTKGAERSRLVDLLSDASADRKVLIGMLHDAGSLEYTGGVAQRFCQEGLEILARLETANSTEPLAAIAASVADRSA